MGFLFMFLWFFLFIFYLEAFLDWEEKEGKTKVDRETPRETFKRGLVNKYTNV